MCRAKRSLKLTQNIGFSPVPSIYGGVYEYLDLLRPCYFCWQTRRLPDEYVPL